MDYSAITDAVDFGAVATAIAVIAGFLAIALVAIRGARMVLGMIGGGESAYEAQGGDEFDAGHAAPSDGSYDPTYDPSEDASAWEGYEYK